MGSKGNGRIALMMALAMSSLAVGLGSGAPVPEGNRPGHLGLGDEPDASTQMVPRRWAKGGAPRYGLTDAREKARRVRQRERDEANRATRAAKKLAAANAVSAPIDVA